MHDEIMAILERVELLALSSKARVGIGPTRYVEAHERMCVKLREASDALESAAFLAHQLDERR